MERYKKFTDMSISVPDALDHYYNRNRKDMTAETAAPSIENNDQYEKNSKKRESLMSSIEI